MEIIEDGRTKSNKARCIHCESKIGFHDDEVQSETILRMIPQEIREGFLKRKKRTEFFKELCTTEFIVCPVCGERIVFSRKFDTSE